MNKRLQVQTVRMVKRMLKGKGIRKTQLTGMLITILKKMVRSSLMPMPILKKMETQMGLLTLRDLSLVILRGK